MAAQSPSPGAQLTARWPQALCCPPGRPSQTRRPLLNLVQHLAALEAGVVNSKATAAAPLAGRDAALTKLEQRIANGLAERQGQPACGAEQQRRVRCCRARQRGCPRP